MTTAEATAYLAQIDLHAIDFQKHPLPTIIAAVHACCHDEIQKQGILLYLDLELVSQAKRSLAAVPPAAAKTDAIVIQANRALVTFEQRLEVSINKYLKRRAVSQYCYN